MKGNTQGHAARSQSKLGLEDTSVFPLDLLRPGQFRGGKQRERLLDLEMLVQVWADARQVHRVRGTPGRVVKAGKGVKERHPRSFAYDVM